MKKNNCVICYLNYANIICEVTKNLILTKVKNEDYLIFLTWRSTNFQIDTYNFLETQFNLDKCLIVMRDDNDESDILTFKKKKLEYINKHFKIKFCIEDDDRNIQMMKDMKLKVIDIKKKYEELNND